MQIENEFVQSTRQPSGRNSRIVTKAKGGSSVLDLVPTLFEMSKAIIRLRCNLDKGCTDDKTLQEISKLEAAIVKMTTDIEYLRRKGH